MSFKLQDALLIAGLALVSTWTIEYFFIAKKPAVAEEQRAGQSFIASDKPLDIRPLNTEVDFIDAQVVRRIPDEREVVETDGARFTFTNQGATLERLEFTREIKGRPDVLTTIYPVSEVDRENRCFLVALEEGTPFNYVKVDRRDEVDRVVLVYQATMNGGVLTKTFTLYKHMFKIDLALQCAVGDKVSYRPRIFFPAPILPDISEHDVVSGLVMNDRGSLTSTPSTKIDFARGWFSPTLFGAQDKYFIHTLVADPTQFVQRAYYHKVDQSPLYAIMEGPLKEGAAAWTLSFYFGPKESSALSAVDLRLEQTLEYAGWFAPISRGLLALLVFLFSYLGNYGVAIIILTILIKIVLWPLSISSARTMKKQGGAADMNKKLRYIEQKYKYDPEALMRERAAITKKQGAMMVSGCLPLLLQLPILYALNRALVGSIILYGASFLWIPDLSARDPYYILSLIIMLSMMMQSLYVDSQQRLTMVLGGVIFGALSTSLSAGLTLYIAVNMLVSALQSCLQQKMKMV